MNELVYERPTYWWYYPEVFLSRVVNAVIGTIEFMLALRLILELLGANAAAPFVAWVYSVSGGFVAPFSGAFASWNVAGFVLDLSIVFAMIGYAIIGWLLLRFISFFSFLR